MPKSLIGWYATSFDPSKASIRLRLLQPVDYLKEKGVKIELFDASAGVARYDAIIFSKSLQWKTLDLARAAKALGKLVIFDICDNIFEGKDSPSKQAKVERLREMFALADIVIFASVGLQEQITRRVPKMPGVQQVIPDMLEDPEGVGSALGWMERLNMMRLARFHKAHAGTLRCVWFGKCQGSKSGLVHAHRAVLELERFSKTRPVALTIIGDQRLRYWQAAHKWRIPHFYLPWTLSTFWTAMREHDVAIIPVERNDYTVGKTINRPATALHAGLGVIADSIPAYEELRPYIVLDDWQEGLHRYHINHPRDDAGCKAARRHLIANYGRSTVGELWFSLFRQVERMLAPPADEQLATQMGG